MLLRQPQHPDLHLLSLVCPLLLRAIASIWPVPAGRMDHLSVDSGAPAASEVSKSEKAAPKLKRAAAKKKAIVLSDSEDVEDESLPSSASESDLASDSENELILWDPQGFSEKPNAAKK